MRKIPNWKERQRLLYSKNKPGNPAELSLLGRECMAAGYLTDALEYFRIAQDRKGLEEIRSRALEDGDAFLLAALEKATGQTFPPETWKELGDRAQALGKLRFAQTAFERCKTEGANDPRSAHAS